MDHINHSTYTNNFTNPISNLQITSNYMDININTQIFHQQIPNLINIPCNNLPISSSTFVEMATQEKQEQEREDQEDQEEEELGAMKEMMYKIAAMQPVEIDPDSIRKPKRRNVRISEDPQSVAARHRRERISEKIRILQRLVPGGTKMDTASMLDEAIRYVKFLKRQIRLLQQSNNSNFNHHQKPFSVGEDSWQQPIRSSAASSSLDSPAARGGYVNFSGSTTHEANPSAVMCFSHEVISD